MTSEANTPRPVELGELPAAITTFLAAERPRRSGTALTQFTPGATVVDEARTHRGTEAIRAWLDTSASEFTYTVEPVSAARTDDVHWFAVNHLEGDFPGGVVDLRFAFVLEAGLIASLVIEPV
jgi:hypothetical protein